MLAILDQDLGNFDVAVLIAAVVFLFAGLLSRPGRDSPAAAYAPLLGFLAAAIFSYAFLWFTP